jgi:predicted nucleic acid-binding protein
MKLAIDTNILAYAEGVNGLERRDKALDLLRALRQENMFIPVQVLGELFNVLVRKAAWTSENARNAILSWHDAFQIIETSAGTIISAIDLATDHRLSIWDSVILAAAAQARCRLLLSEDLQDGFTWSGVTVTNPFVPTLHPLLQASLQGGGR